MRYLALYGRAHALYLRKEYQQAIGEVEAASALMQQAYPVAAIYLNIVGAMASNSLARHEDAQRFFDRAWALALPEGYIEPFAEHHGMLQGLVERKLRGTQPELYQQVIGPCLSLQPRLDEDPQSHLHAQSDGRAHTL